MKRLLPILISFVFIPFIADEVRACTCIEYDTPVCAAYWRADVVFVGHLREITPHKEGSEKGPSTAMLHFLVDQPFRGIAGDQVDVETLFGTSCDMKFEKGERYLIYASQERGSNQLFAPPCTRTTNLKYADADLTYIRAVTHEGAKESITGRLLRNRFQPLPGLKITVHGGDKTIEATTDKQGDFTLSLPATGNYTVRAFIPFAAAVMANREDESGKIVSTTDNLTIFEYEVEIEKNHCDFRQIDTFKIDLDATAEISGSVLTASGRPVSAGYVYLVDAADSDASRFEKLGDNGSFKFEGVAVGEYYVVLNPRNEAPDENDAPYPRTYYPKAAEATQATKIVVTEGAKLENVFLRLGAAWKERLVAGMVMWQDGRPIQDARIVLYDGDRFVESFKSDEKGRFKFKVYGDFKYVIHAETWAPTLIRSEHRSLADQSTGLKLILKRID